MESRLDSLGTSPTTCRPARRSRSPPDGVRRSLIPQRQTVNHDSRRQNRSDRRSIRSNQRTTLRVIIRTRARTISGLAATSLTGGILEAAFLVLVTRAAFAVTSGKEEVGTFAGHSAALPVVLVVALVLVVLRVVAAIATAGQSARLTAELVASIRRDLASAFLRASWTSQHKNSGGRLQELLTTFAQQGAVLGITVSGAVTNGFSLSALLIAAIIVDPVASLALIGAVVALGSVLRPLRNSVRKQAQSTASTGMDFAVSLNEISQLGMEMHVFGIQDETEERVDTLISDNEVTTRHLRRLQGLIPAIYNGLAYLAVLGALAVVAAMDTTNLSSIGSVMLIMLRSLSYGQGLQVASAGINGALPFLTSLDSELEGFRSAALLPGHASVEGADSIVVDEVSFEYVAEKPVLTGLSFEIGPKEIVGVIGPSGGGKSTLVQLLLGLRPPTVGRITTGGHDLSEINSTQWVRHATFVPQEPHLVTGTVAENIRFFREGVTDEAIETASRLANLHQDVSDWPEGYDRLVGSQGSELSGGQRQRLIIARALVEHPEFLILDEPTSALDVRSESLIRSTLHDLREHMTIVIVAHRLSTLDICDRIMVIQDGTLLGFDTPSRLKQSSKFYSEALTMSGLA